MFKGLFSFKEKEISLLFDRASRKGSIPGLLLLQASLDQSACPEGGQGACFGKLLIIIPRKVGVASVRNKLRRQLKAIFWEHELYKKPVASILLVYKQAVALEFAELRNFLQKFLA